MTRKISKGRQRVEMVKIMKASNLGLTFSKCRAGLFKKASELCTLCGVEIVIVIFSSDGKNVFSFGHPSVDTLVERFLGRNLPPPNNDVHNQQIVARREAGNHELNTCS
ncbi:hypothetical protein KY290_021412 [Solanum tuberosum]|uniref:MADS-box domain-containing protein n=1 Tax=Solanum tuberosum TaxID=4113 RepID=A0ABQ7V1G5_SOLTU|nr:hypothetical protein KY289_020575 [Solanum tuberosum]KAH0757919.1 hypothetical protein KY290_021412 [Solanum tuberosum]